MDNTEQELARLVLKNLDMVEKSWNLLSEIDAEFLEKINKKFEQWYEEVKQNTAWPRSLGNKKDQEGIWFGLGLKGWFKKIDTYTKDATWVSLFTELVRDEDSEVIQTGIYFGFTRNFFKLNARESKDFMQKQFKKYPELSQANFQYVSEDIKIFLPVKLNLEKLVEEYPDYADAFLPLEEALDTVTKYMPVFKAIAKDLIVKHLKEEYQQEE